MKTRVLTLLGLIFSVNSFFAQDNLTTKVLAPFTYSLQIADGNMKGPGADFLRKEAQESQYMVLGEYHGSPRISEFTEALIPVLHEAAYSFFALEVGPISAQILAELSAESSETQANLRAFNTAYLMPLGERSYTPIPFFGHEEDAAFLQAASERDWRFMGLDQEFSFSFFPLLDRLNFNLQYLDHPDTSLLPAARDTLLRYYTYDFNRRAKLEGVKRKLATSLYQSDYFKALLGQLGKSSEENQAICEAWQETVAIYYANNTGNYWQCNSERIAYMKRQLAEQMNRFGFEQETDKLLLKIGGVHAGKGLSPLRLMEVGNTLHELAAFQGKQSLHITCFSRYYEEHGEVKDELADPAGWSQRFAPLLQMAHPNHWVLIDLRPLRERVFYHNAFQLSPQAKELFHRFDVMLIQPAETEPIPNWID
ncbi:MAG: hypothetical protein AAF399_04130 [Bacteroidota bacterium]